MKVRATRLGFYGHSRRKEGQVFHISGEKAFSKEWMEVVDANSKPPKPSKKEAKDPKDSKKEKEKEPAEDSKKSTGNQNVLEK